MSAHPGNSGGPVFNKKGEVIGVLSTKLSKADGVSFAIKSKNIYQLIEDYKKTDTTSASIKMANATTLAGDERVSQVKKISHYVYMIKAYRK
jgi:S1-C subfamily serine protease